VADALDRLAAPNSDEPLTGLTTEELRHRRNELQRTEEALSYVRRILQGRLDIVLDERQHRADGTGGRDVSSVVADLPKILAEHLSSGSRGALPSLTQPSGEFDDVLTEVDRIIDAGRLGSIGKLSDAELSEAADALTELEHRVSRHRRTLHAAIDTLQEEIIRRYKSGEASVDALLP
jgi:hypothetical protein